MIVADRWKFIHAPGAAPNFTISAMTGLNATSKDPLHQKSPTEREVYPGDDAGAGKIRQRGAVAEVALDADSSPSVQKQNSTLPAAPLTPTVS